MITPADRFWMKRALALAQKGLFTARPNPCVGCILVRDHQSVGEGYHHQAGQPHAEIHALNQSGALARGATAYVTLEPCVHQGRTGPCVPALIQAGVARVVIAMADPFALVAGQGVAQLQAAGIEVRVGVLAEESMALNRGFLKRVQQGRPYVRVKLGLSLDGRIALENGQSQWITSPQARQRVQYWRARSGAILTTAKTVITDNPSLLVRDAAYTEIPHFQQPLRVIVDRQAQLEAYPDLKIFHDGFPLRCVQGNTLSLVKLLESLAQEQEIQEVLVEAGGIFLGALLEAGCVDELLIFMAPKLLGPDAQAMVQLPLLSDLSDHWGLVFEAHESVGPDLFIQARVMGRETQHV